MTGIISFQQSIRGDILMSLKKELNAYMQPIDSNPAKRTRTAVVVPVFHSSGTGRIKMTASRTILTAVWLSYVPTKTRG